MRRKYIEGIGTSTILKTSAVLLLLFAIFNLASIGFVQSPEISCNSIEKFLGPNQENSNVQFVKACLSDYQITTRFGRIQQNPTRDNPYDIDLFSLNNNGDPVRIAVFNFWNPEPEHIVRFNDSQNYYDIHAPAHSYLSIVDLLRNEADIQLVIEKNDGFWSGWLRTFYEPIGEAE